MTTIAISGASGLLGRRTAELVLATTAPEQLVLVSRDPSKLDDVATRGVQVRRGDFDAPETLADAFAGVERLLLISTDVVGGRVAQHTAAIDAAKAAGVRHIAYTSLLNPAAEHPTGALGAEHHASEAALRDSGLAWTFLRNSIYLDLQLDGWAHAVATGQLVTNSGAGRIAYVTREDCAAAAAAVLTGSGHEQQIYDVAGPELTSHAEIAATLAAVSGRPVEVVAVADDAYTAGLVAAGVPQQLAEILTGVGVAIRDGLQETQTDVVERLTGRRPTSLQEFLTAHSAQLLA